MSQVAFTLFAKAVPQGSKRGFVVPGKEGRKARAVVVDVNQKEMRAFRYDLRMEAKSAMCRACLDEPLAGRHVPVEITLEFSFVPPQSMSKKRIWPVVLPDIDKLERAVLDALHGVIFVNDSQVVRVHKEKVYGKSEQVHVSARIITESPSLF